MLFLYLGLKLFLYISSVLYLLHFQAPSDAALRCSDFFHIKPFRLFTRYRWEFFFVIFRYCGTSTNPLFRGTTHIAPPLLVLVFVLVFVLVVVLALVLIFVFQFCLFIRRLFVVVSSCLVLSCLCLALSLSCPCLVLYGLAGFCFFLLGLVLSLSPLVLCCLLLSFLFPSLFWLCPFCLCLFLSLCLYRLSHPRLILSLSFCF
jgi:hypothetical protein